jgi:formylglycine-generating enzyme required for sulfatase activity
MLIRVPAGPFTMGTPEEAVDEIVKTYGGAVQREEILKETPARQVHLPAYAIGKFLVTNQEFQAFVLEGGAPPRSYWEGLEVPPFLRNCPVWEVTWEEAEAYCHWLSEITGRNFRLPSEAEWEKAARGTDAREFPWGNQFRFDRANTREARLGGPTPVGVFPDGVSPYGVLDMAGNVAEWTASEIAPYPGSPHRESIAQEIAQYGRYRVVRSGCWREGRQFARCAARRRPVGPDAPLIGFRVACDVA